MKTIEAMGTPNQPITELERTYEDVFCNFYHLKAGTDIMEIETRNWARFEFYNLCGALSGSFRYKVNHCSSPEFTRFASSTKDFCRIHQRIGAETNTKGESFSGIYAAIDASPEVENSL